MSALPHVDGAQIQGWVFCGTLGWLSDLARSDRHIVVPSLAEFTEQWHFSHAVRATGLLLLSGVTGTDVRGVVDPDPARQFEQAFVHLADCLEAAGAGMADSWS